MQRLDNSGRLVGWSIGLNEFDIEYLPRKAIKGQALADFVAEFSGFPPKTVATPTKKS